MDIKRLGLVEYSFIYSEMLKFCKVRVDNFREEIWALEHFSVYTLGKSSKDGDLLSNNLGIPVIRTDRGGKITYHGPGQLIIYPLINFARRRISIRDLVLNIESSIIDTLLSFGLKSYIILERPGVYMDNKKIASIGLRISNGVLYHGLSLNINMDMNPFNYINPCGYEDLKMTQISDYLNPCPRFGDVRDVLLNNLVNRLK